MRRELRTKIYGNRNQAGFAVRCQYAQDRYEMHLRKYDGKDLSRYGAELWDINHRVELFI